jgi:hypothetical protein
MVDLLSKKLQKEEQEKGFTKPNVDQIIKETNLEKLRELVKLKCLK